MTACPSCRGSGRQITEDNFRPCPTCGGEGSLEAAIKRRATEAFGIPFDGQVRPRQAKGRK